MFKSFSDSIRSLWQQRTQENATVPIRKRKRTSNDVDLDDPDDSDVEIVSVKKPKQESSSSIPGLFSFLTVPMSKMSDWVKKKTVRQDHVFVQPLPSRRNRTEPQQLGMHHQSSSISTPTTNGSFPHTESADRLSRQPIHRNGVYENGVNGDAHTPSPLFDSCNLSSSSRRSSCSSVRSGLRRHNTVHQCFQLKEKEDFRKLLQQYTTIDLGYDAAKKTNPARGSSTRTSHTQRKREALPVLPPPLSTSLQSSGSFGFGSKSLQLSTRLRVTPSHSVQSPLLPSDRLRTHSTSSSSDSSVRLEPSGLSHSVISPSGLPATARARRRQSSHNQGKTERHQKAGSSLEDDPEIVIVEDSNKRQESRPVSLNFTSSQYLDDDWINRLKSKYASAEEERQQLIKEAEAKKKLLEETREERLGSLDKKLRQQMRLFEGDVEVVEDLFDDQEEPLPELTDAMQKAIDSALANGPQIQTLSEGFRLQLTRGDFATLRGLNWLNDEIINFYMNMLMERGEKEGFGKTYAFSTFFYPKLTSGGHAAVKRWTRKVDIFSHQYLVIPVHLGVHWCLCVVFMKEKTICYYDSMGGNNNQCLNAVRQYLYDESLQKRNIQLDLSEWSTEIVKDIPQQMNGSDCGMFSCMYAESLTRGAKITFTQEDMPYFRRRMVYELLTKQLL